MNVDANLMNMISATIFALAVLHTFSVKFFENLSKKSKHHSGLWHLLAEIEIVFGFWAVILVIFLSFNVNFNYAIEYVENKNYTEPLFIFVIMVIAASKPILDFCFFILRQIVRIIPFNKSVTFFFLILFLLPLLGSFITEPAAMTVAALLLKDYYYSKKVSEKFKYAAIAVLFVNISIGGALTPYAAPPILMVAQKWNWDISFMLQTFGWRAAAAVFINALIFVIIFYKELKSLKLDFSNQIKETPPFIVKIVHLLFLGAVVYFIHHPVIFLAIFIFFIGFTVAYSKYQTPLYLRQGMLVGFFLAGLVLLGGKQEWWLQPLIKVFDENILYYGTLLLSAIADNAALTYLGSLINGLTDDLKYSIVAGAISGGGLTVIANAPNPAGYSILKNKFKNNGINLFMLFAYAVPPTFVAIIFFKLI
jgi:hypothetical protein